MYQTIAADHAYCREQNDRPQPYTDPVSRDEVRTIKDSTEGKFVAEHKRSSITRQPATVDQRIVTNEGCSQL